MDEITSVNIASEHELVDLSDDSDEIPESQDRETNVIVTELSEQAKLKMEVIQSLISARGRKTYGQKLKEATEKLGKSVRTVQRMVKKYELILIFSQDCTVI